MKNAAVFLALALVLAIGAFGQTNPILNPAPADAPTASFLSKLSDPVTLGLAAYDLSQVASGTTSWKWTILGKSYSVNPAQKTGIAVAATIAGAGIAHKWPKLKPWLAGALGLASGYYAGIAYWNSRSHGAQTATPMPAMVAVQFGK